MDRQIVYPGAIPLDTDILNVERNVMIAIGALAESVFGSSTFVSGLACTPTTPTADMNVHVGRGRIGQLATIDASAFGALPADTTDPLVKMGINVATTNFPITAPTTSGFSQNYLIECQLQETDGGAIVMPYYNAANPSVAYSGPSNSGTAQNSVRIQRAALQLKAGSPAATGTQATPGADAGWVPLWIISVNYGQTQITSTSIATAPGAPFIGTLLTQNRTKLMGNLTLYVSSTGSDANNGLLQGTSFATIQAAWNALINNYDLNGYSATISVGAGNFAPLNAAGVCQGQGANSVILITGAGANTIITSSGIGGTVSASGGAQIAVSNIQHTGAFGLQAFNGSMLLNSGGNTFGTCSQVHQFANGGQITLNGNCTISGGASSHFATANGGVIYLNGSSGYFLPTSSTPNFSAGFAVASTGVINVGGIVFSNSSSGATGPRFVALLGGSINTGTNNINFFPGNTAGNTGSGTNTGFYA